MTKLINKKVDKKMNYLPKKEILLLPAPKVSKGARLTSFLFIFASLLVAAGILWAANTYYNIDTGEIVVENIQRVANVIRATAGIIVGGTAGQSPNPGVTFQVASGNVLFNTSGTITQTGTGQVTFAGNVDAQSGLDVTGSNFTVGETNFVVDVTTGRITWSGDTNLYRSAANVLRTDDDFIVGGSATIGGTITINTNTIQATNALTIQFDDAGGFILQNDLATPVKFLEIGTDGKLTLRSGGTADLVLDAASGVVRLGAGDTLYADNVALGGEGDLKGIIPIFGFDLPAQTATTSWVQVSRVLQNYPFPSAVTGTTRVHKLIFRYSASTTAPLDWRVSTTTGAAYSTGTLAIPDSNDLEKGNAQIVPVSIPTDGTDWWLEIKTPDIPSVVRIYQIFLAAFDVKQ